MRPHVRDLVIPDRAGHTRDQIVDDRDETSFRCKAVFPFHEMFSTEGRQSGRHRSGLGSPTSVAVKWN